MTYVSRRLECIIKLTSYLSFCTNFENKLTNKKHINIVNHTDLQAHRWGGKMDKSPQKYKQKEKKATETVKSCLLFVVCTYSVMQTTLTTTTTTSTPTSCRWTVLKLHSSPISSETELQPDHHRPRTERNTFNDQCSALLFCFVSHYIIF